MGSLLKMIFSQQVRNSTVYYLFLKGVLYIIQNIPTSCSKYVAISAKYFIAALPLIYAGFISLMSIAAQHSISVWLVFSKLKSKQRQINGLKEKLDGEINERAVLHKSSELLMECIKTLQKKLDDEIVTRRIKEFSIEKERAIQVKRMDSIDARVDRLKSN